MSRIWSAGKMDAAQAVGGWGAFGSVGDTGSGFRTLYGEETGRAWNNSFPAEPSHADMLAEPADAIEQAAQEAFLQGFREGERLTREAMEQDDTARIELSQAIAMLGQAGEGVLAALLSQAVIRLVTQVIGEVPIDEDVLKARCEAVAACIDSDEAKAVLEVSPEDLPLLQQEQLGMTLAANADLSRGSVRLATSDGWVEDGPDVRLDRLKALMDDMEGKL